MIRILLVHPEPTLRQHIAGMLAAAGHDVVAVERATLALPLLAERRFDLLLADIVLPEMDGIELAQRCTELSRATRIMLITGFAAVALATPAAASRPDPAPGPIHLRQVAAELERMFPSPIIPAAGASRASRLQAAELGAKGTALPGEPG